MPEDGHHRIDTFRAAPPALVYAYVVAAISLLPFFAFYGAIVYVLRSDGRRFTETIAALIVGFAVLKAIAVFAVIRIEWELRCYVVTDRSLRVREGVGSVREITLTYANVQNVTVEQGPIERMLGIANVRVETAGGGGGAGRAGLSVGNHQARLRGIANAEQVRDLIQRHLEQAPKQSGLGDPDDEAGSRRRRRPAAPGGPVPGPEGGSVELLEAVLAELRGATRAARMRRRGTGS